MLLPFRPVAENPPKVGKFKPPAMRAVVDSYFDSLFNIKNIGLDYLFITISTWAVYMAIINPKKMEVECKIVYYGPGRCGKTTNLEYIFRNSKRFMTDEMVSVETKGDKTLFFDFAPMGLGKIKGCDVRVHLYTVPGQVKYSSTRKLVLKGADGVVFVADSLEVRHEKNILSLKDLSLNLKEHGHNILDFPVVMQYNKRDLAKDGLSLLPIEKMEKAYNSQLKAPSFPASAINGEGVNDTLKTCLVLTLRSLKKEAGWA